MRCFRLHIVCLVVSTSFLEGCNFGAPNEPTQTQILKSDAKTQAAIKQYYGNMIGPRSGAKGKATPK